MTLPLIPILVCVIGLLVYGLAGNTKVQEIGRLSFFAGLLVTLLVLASVGALRLT